MGWYAPIASLVQDVDCQMKEEGMEGTRMPTSPFMENKTTNYRPI